jgi:hypothetical protein
MANLRRQVNVANPNGTRRRKYSENLALAQAAETEDGCWPWPTTDSNGYSTVIRVNGRRVNAHVGVYLREVGVVPPGLTLDHTCHTTSASCSGGRSCLHRRCVRPSHLEPVTLVEQQRRQPKYRSATCPNGHVRTEANTLWAKDLKGAWYRQCRDCNHERYEKRKAVQAPGIYVAGAGYVGRNA